MTELLTPMMRQYRALKRQHPDAMLLFRCGDFYETYFEDAIEAGRILGITVTRKTAGADGEVPMAGVPFHSIESYLQRLVKAGRHVALAEQVEDPKTAKGLVRREIVQVVTPGTVLEPGLLDARANNYIIALAWQPLETAGSGGAAAVAARARIANSSGAAAPRFTVDDSLFADFVPDPAAPAGPAPPPPPSNGSIGAHAPAHPAGTFGIALADLTTGHFAITDFSGEEATGALASELVRLEPAEVLAADGFDTESIVPAQAGRPFSVTRRPADRFEGARARAGLARHFGVQTLDGFGVEGMSDAAVGAAGALLDYLQEMHKGALPHIRELRVYRHDDGLVLDATTQRSLELVRNLHTGNADFTLLSVLDRTLTPMGARMLRGWLLKPLGARSAIEQRLDAVGGLVAAFALRQSVAEALRGIPDLERVAGRIAVARATPRDLVAVRQTLERIPRLRAALATSTAALLRDAAAALDPMPALVERLRAALTDDPPNNAREPGIIRPGWDSQLDEIKRLAGDSKTWIADYRAREAQRTGIANLKISFNKVFGYSIELTHAQIRAAGQLPADYERRQTLTNGERFITAELKEKEEIILHATEKAQARETELFEALRAEVAAHLTMLLDQARVIAQVDSLLSLAEVALSGAWVRPSINEAGRIAVREGRHPVLEAASVDQAFVPNDTRLDREACQIALITGPNMAGKSTYIRQVALIAILAHMGSFVPAREADITTLDRIFTRVGAMDHLARGQSTFLVEMVETAAILNSASERSLVILDEIGRGTSTYDGMSIAWSVLEYLHSTSGRRPLALFATHYHELTDLEGRLPRLRNFNVAVVEENDRIEFLYRILRGPANRSYGIYAAKLAGVPPRVIRRAKTILKSLETGTPLLVDSGTARPSAAAPDPAESQGPALESQSPTSDSAVHSTGTVGSIGSTDPASSPTDSPSASTAINPSRRKGRLQLLTGSDDTRVALDQLSLFDAPPHPVVERLRNLPLERLTPLDALNLLHELRESARKGS